MSDFKYAINPKTEEFLEFLQETDKYFKTDSQTIHKARNELKIIPYNNIETVVKSFRVPNIIRRIIYTFFRDSKAKKSYEYSLKIGNFTPEPIGYIEFYKNSLLERSYFVAKKFEYDFTIREPLLNNSFKNKITQLDGDEDFIILNTPNNPTASVMMLEELCEWVEYALKKML